jgi:hypothetical protein
MDTGNISFSQLGINGRYANSFFVRRRNICSPLVDEPFRYNVIIQDGRLRLWTTNRYKR